MASNGLGLNLGEREILGENVDFDFYKLSFFAVKLTADPMSIAIIIFPVILFDIVRLIHC